MIDKIVQTPDYIVILSEMIHDARIVPFTARPISLAGGKWFGDSVGRWEGETLVVETINFSDKTRFRGSSRQLKVTERFSRIDERMLLYRFTVDDPSTWARPWTGEYTGSRSRPGDQVHEYACHEGNYALSGIMKGARLLDAEAAVAAKH